MCMVFNVCNVDTCMFHLYLQCLCLSVYTCLCVSVSVCVCILYVCMCTCVYTSICLCACVLCMCAYCMCVHACMRACMRVCVCMCIHVYVVCVHTVCVCVYMHTCMCTCATPDSGRKTSTSRHGSIQSPSWSCIDYVMMRQLDRGLCLDVAARRGAKCNTDHHLVCMKLRLKRTPGGRVSEGVKYRRFDVLKLRDKCAGVEEESVKSQYLQEVLERAENEWCDKVGVEGKWSAVKSALVAIAEEVFGRAGRLQPGWFRESIEALQPLLVARNAAYSRWLGTGRTEDLSKFQQARSTAKRAIRKAKNDWFQEKAREIEREKVWKAIREMKHGCRGLLP